MTFLTFKTAKLKNGKTAQLHKGFTLLEILVAVIILAVGVLTVSQMTILGIRTNKVIQDRARAREVLAKGMEVIKMLPMTDPLLTANKDSLTLDDTTGAYKSDTSNVVGRTVSQVGYDVYYDIYWNVADDFPSTGVKTIRMFIKRQDKRIMDADYVKWR
jgi:prepilin-type N-terminal cleavage/methylation domain-containing protein